MNLLYQRIKKYRIFFLSAFLIIVLFGLFYFYNKSAIPDNSLNVKEINEAKSDQQNLVLDNDSTDISEDVQYKSIYLLNGSTLKLKFSSGTKKWPVLTAQEKIFISDDSKIIADYQNPLNKPRIRIFAVSHEFGGEGGSLAGLGGYGDCLKPIRNSLPPMQKSDFFDGAPGASAYKVSDSQGGRGGGNIIIRSNELIIHGLIVAKGENGFNSGGGGSGGNVIIDTKELTIKGKIDVSGGNGGDGQIHGGGGGSGGFIYLKLGKNNKERIEDFINLEGGKGGITYDMYTGCSGGEGEDGKFIKECTD